MSARLDTGVELLERSLGYTRVALVQVRPSYLTRPTPCARWDLAALLAHMDDALDAFLEAAEGSVRVSRSAPAATPGPAILTRLQDKACALLGTWSAAVSHPRASVDVGGVSVEAALLVDAAAVEITVHGWDVATALGVSHPIPEALAEALLPATVELAGLGHFAAPVRVAADAGADVRLLAALGRSIPGVDPQGGRGVTPAR